MDRESSRERSSLRMRRKRMILVTIVLSVAMGIACYTLAMAGWKKKVHIPEFLSEEYLRGSMQGKSGISLDLNGDGHLDLIIGAPYAHHRGTSGALLIHLATPRGLQGHA